MAICLRVRFSKLGKLRFTSHRDVARMWERALRRSGLEVARSQGFNPRPLVAFGLALPTGAESLAEYLDVSLGAEPPCDLGVLANQLTGFLPEGVDVMALGMLAGAAGSLQQEVSSCSWELEVLGVTASEMATRVERLLDARSVSVRRERKGRQFDDDLRPSVRSLALFEPSHGDDARRASAIWLRAETATRPRGVRPRELAEVLGTEVVLARARRTQQWIERDGDRWEPLGADDPERAVMAPHVVERVS
ncbi:MAG: TIGR03936 family radical SAM-associated protein [Acidimicrobiales bacterium]